MTASCASIVPRWETELRREALVRSAHHSTSIEGNPLQIKLLNYLRQSGGGSISISEYRELFAISKRTASNDLSQLLVHGLLEHEGAGPSTRYRLALVGS